MAEGFLGSYLIIVAAWGVLGAGAGAWSHKANRKRGAVWGLVLGLALGFLLASISTFTGDPRNATANLTE